MAKKTNISDSKPKSAPATIIDVRIGMDVDSLKQAITEHLFYQQGRKSGLAAPAFTCNC